MKKMLDLRLAWVVSLIGVIQPALGQSNVDTPPSRDRDIVSSIATYQTDLRSAVLDVAQYPQVLVKLERIQARSSQSFQDLISRYPREEQEKFYELSRFPDRLNLLVRDRNQKSTAEAKHMLEDLPKETQASILDVYNNHFSDLTKIHSIYQSSEDAMQKATADYPQQLQSDFQKVISRPEVMNLLTENIDLTTSLGEDYRTNPNAVVEQLDSLNNQQQKDLADYKKEAENNPEMQQEMRNAADRFSSSYAQNDSPVGSYLDNQPANYSNSAPIINNYYSYNPYPYWFSYPYWYAIPIWYSVPYYYNTGFYYGLDGRIVIWGFPSYAYSNWFFNFGFPHYPHLYSHYDVYYHGNYTSSGHGGGYRGYRSTRNGYSDRRNQDQYGSRGGNAGHNNRTSGNNNRAFMNRNQTAANDGRTLMNSNRMQMNNNRTLMNSNRMQMDYNRTQMNNNRMQMNNSRTQMNSNRNTATNRNPIGSNQFENRTSVPIRQYNAPSSNFNSRSSQQVHSGSFGSIGRQPSGGGSRGGFSGSRGGSSGGGGGGRSGGGGGRRGR